MNHSPLQIAKDEEIAHRKASVSELGLLDWVCSYKELLSQEQLLGDITNNLEQVRQFNEVVNRNYSNEASWALKTNKLVDYLGYGQEILNNTAYYNDLMACRLPGNFIMDPAIETRHGGFGNDVKGTAYIPNGVQAVLATALNCLLSDKDSLTNLDLEGAPFQNEEDSIYNKAISPNLQGVTLPKNLLNDHPEFKTHIYIDEEDNELIVFGTGYQFGGSRADPQYASKIFRFEDCSSAVAKWIGLEDKVTFTTRYLHMFYNNECGNDKDCKAIGDKLTRIDAAIPGAIYAFRKATGEGHTGIVTKVFNDTCFDLLSYARNIPTEEGLGYKTYCLEDNRPNVVDMFFGYVGDQQGGEMPPHSDEL